MSDPGDETDDDDRYNVCDLCGESVADKQWVILNRFLVGTGRGRCMSEVHNSDDEYLWMPGDETDSDDYVTGTLLCFPVCLTTWLEGKMVSVDFELKRRRK